MSFFDKLKREDPDSLNYRIMGLGPGDTYHQLLNAMIARIIKLENRVSELESPPRYK